MTTVGGQRSTISPIGRRRQTVNDGRSKFMLYMLMNFHRKSKKIFFPIFFVFFISQQINGDQLGAGGAYKLFVNRDGFYVLDATSWKEMGIDPASFDVKTIRIFHRGEEIPVDIVGGKVLFYGRRRRDGDRFYDRYGVEDVYRLTWGEDRGRLMAVRNVLPVRGYPASSTYREVLHYEVDKRYEPLGLVREPVVDHWFWDRLDVAEGWKDFDLQIDGYDWSNARPVVLRVSLYGATDLPAISPDHHAVFAINRQFIVGHLRWDGSTEELFRGTLPWPFVRNGRYRLSMRLPGDTAIFDSAILNWFEVEYDRSRVVRDGELFFTEDYGKGGGRRIVVEGFTRPFIRLYDLTQGDRLSGFTITYQKKDKRYAITFEDAASGPITYYAVQEDRMRRPPRSIIDQPSFLRSPGNAADYLIITHADFTEAIDPLVRLHEDEGLRVNVVNVEDVYDEFDAGRFGPEPIRAFLRYAFTQWRGRPVYVLLVGDESWDHRGLLNRGGRSFIPAFYFQSSQRGEAPTDHLYACVDGDDLLPDLFIGRLPVRTLEEARKVVQKIVRAERSPAGGDWRRRVVYFADNDPFFRQSSDTLSARYTRPLWYGETRVDAKGTRDDQRLAIEVINGGCALLNFVGHGSATLMASFLSASSLGGENVSRLRNDGKMPLILAFSCLNGMFAEPGLQSLGEVMVNKADGGAIAYIASSTLGWTVGDAYLNDAIFEQIFKHGERRFGAILAKAKVRFAERYTDPEDFLKGYTLFGDPAGKLPLELLQVAGTEEVQDTSGTTRGKIIDLEEDGPPQLQEVLNVPNPVTRGGGTTFTYVLMGRAEVLIGVYTLSGRPIARLDHLPGDVGFNQVEWDGLDDRGEPLANGVYLYKVVARNQKGRDEVIEKLVVMR